jgi:hypothetical protein
VEAKPSVEGLFANYRGLSARVWLHPETGKATEISWYISGKVDMVSPVSATVDVAKRFPHIQPSDNSVDRPIKGRVNFPLCNSIEMSLFDF